MTAHLGKEHFSPQTKQLTQEGRLPSFYRAINYRHGDDIRRNERLQASTDVLNFLLQTADSIGVDLRPLLRDGGLSLSANRLACVAPSLPLFKLTSIYRKCIALLAEQSTDEVFQNPPSFEDNHIFCSCLINCDTLEHAIHTTINFFRLLNNRWGEVAFSACDKEATFFLNIGRQSGSISSLYIDMIGLAFLYKLFSWLIGESLDARKVTLAHKSLVDTSMLISMVDCPIQLNMAANSIVFRKELLSKPIVRTRQELIKTLRIAPFELMPLVKNMSLPRRLEKLFEKALTEKSEIPALEQVAAMLGQSGPTLRRHLAREGTSFQELLDKCRMNRAISLLLQPDLTLDELSANLGFSASSGFSRAFKDWTGYSPSSYRQMLGANMKAVG